MTIPSKISGNWIPIVEAPRNKYSIPEVSEDGICLNSAVDASVFDPTLLLAAQFAGKLYVSPEKQFFTNLHQIVYNDFIKRSKEWNTYLKLRGWNSLDQQDQVAGRAAACCIQQEYSILAELGKEERCMFKLECIAGHLEELMRLENLFYSLMD